MVKGRVLWSSPASSLSCRTGQNESYFVMGGERGRGTLLPWHQYFPVGCSGFGMHTLFTHVYWVLFYTEPKGLVQMIWAVVLCCEGVHGVPVSSPCMADFRDRTDYKTAKLRKIFMLDKTCCTARAYGQLIARLME